MGAPGLCSALWSTESCPPSSQHENKGEGLRSPVEYISSFLLALGQGYACTCTVLFLFNFAVHATCIPCLKSITLCYHFLSACGNKMNHKYIIKEDHLITESF